MPGTSLRRDLHRPDPTMETRSLVDMNRLRAFGFALLAVAAVAAVEQVIEHFARLQKVEEEKLAAQRELDALRARMEGVIRANLLLVHGLSAVISANPEINQAGFARIARGLVDEPSALRNIAGAPGMVVSLMYPMEGNQAAIGLDYRTHPEQRAAAMRVQETGKPWVAGPLRLVQGGMGVVLRAPVLVPAREPPGERRFWGVVAAVIDLGELYRQADLDDLPDRLELAIRGRDGTGPDGPVFYGDPGLFGRPHVTARVDLPGGSWQLGVRPDGAWHREGGMFFLIRVLGLLAALAAGTLTYLLVRGSQSLSSQNVRLRTLMETRRRAEEALAKSEAGYRQLFEQNPVPMLVYERGSLRLLAVNEAFAAHYGYTVQQALALVLTDLYPREDREAIKELASRVKGLAYVGEWRHVKRDGSVIDVEARSHDLIYEGHDARVAVVTDITARRQAQVALQEQEAFFRLIAESMGDMVAVLDVNGRRLYNSPSYQQLFGSDAALEGTDSFADVHPEDRQRVHEAFRDTVETGHGRRLAFRFLLPDGSVRQVESQGGVIRGADGRVERVVVVSRDVTERKRLDDEIRALNADLEERVRQRTAELAAANRELETFSYSVSHDLKAPLRGIDGYARLLQEDYQDRLDEDGRLFLRNVRDGVDQMSRLIEDLLEYSRLERQELARSEVELGPLVEAVLRERQPELTACAMEVDAELGGARARADVAGALMVVRNLVDNAIKFTRGRERPRLRIRAETGPESTILVFDDNGIGFDMQFHDRIFDIFQRLQRAEDYPGTGVGLAIVAKAVQRMGGRVWGEGVPGRGARFSVELPR